MRDGGRIGANHGARALASQKPVTHSLAVPLIPLLQPMLATAGPLPADEAAYAFEPKWDGFRALVSVDGRVKVRSRQGKDLGRCCPELAALPGVLDTRVLLDGELVAFGPNGQPSFDLMLARRGGRHSVPVCFMVFDVLWADGSSLVDLPYEDRRHALEQLKLDGPYWRATPAYVGRGSELLAATQEHNLEGLVAKRLGSRYCRSAQPVLDQDQELPDRAVRGGWLEPSRSPERPVGRPAGRLAAGRRRAALRRALGVRFRPG